MLSLTGGYSPGPEFSQDGRIVVSVEDQLTTYQVDPALEYRSFAHVFWIADSFYEQRRSAAMAGCWPWARDGGVLLWDLARGTELPFLAIGNAWHLMFEASGDLLTSGIARRVAMAGSARPDSRNSASAHRASSLCRRDRWALPRTDRAGSWPWHTMTHALVSISGADDSRWTAGRLPLCCREPGRAMVGNR